MKNLSLLTFFLTLFFISNSQNIVTTSPQLKSAIIEAYTGINCPWCPGGATEIQGIMDSYPEQVFSLSIHGTSFATPNDESHPDFRTSFANSLISNAGVTGLPSGTVNRNFFSEYSSGALALSTNQYRGATEKIIQESAYANIGYQSNYNSETGLLTVDVEVYYVENLPFGIESNFINIAIIESNIYGYQSNGGSNYNHKRVLRHFVTDTWGDEIEGMQAGDLISRQYTYTLNEEWIPENCELVVFLSETRKDIINGVGGDLIDGFNDGEIAPDYARVYTNNSIEEGASGSDSEFEITLINGNNEEYQFNVELEFNAPLSWDVKYIVNDQEYVNNATITVPGGVSETINLVVTPSNESGVAHCKLKVSSYEDNSLPVKETEAFVISGVDNLIIYSSGTLTGTYSEDYLDSYYESLSNSGCTTYGAIPSYALEEAIRKNALNNIDNIYLNIGYSKPVLTVGQTEYLTDFIDDGGNVFLAGQDIGRDIMGTGGHSTSITQKSFFQNYIGAAYVNQGDSDNNQINFVENDNIFGGIESSALFDPYNDILKPDNVIKLNSSSSEEFITYPNNRAGGIRNVKNGKIVYLSFGLEQVQDTDIRDSIMIRTYQWFTGWEGLSNEQYSISNNITVYPNPASNLVNINISEEFSNYPFTVNIIDKLGKKVMSLENLTNPEFTINIENLSSGIYFYEIESISKEVYRGKIVVE